jgi:hypothetical protein
VHLCRANTRTTGEELAALKIYHPLDRRDFRDESLYRDGEFIKERRIRVAIDKRTRYGREVQGGIWVGREWDMLRLERQGLGPSSDRGHRASDTHVVRRGRRGRRSPAPAVPDR